MEELYEINDILNDIIDENNKNNIGTIGLFAELSPYSDSNLRDFQLSTIIWSSIVEFMLQNFAILTILNEI